MQLRLHPVMEQLKIAYEVTNSDTIKKSVIKFITPRDKDYLNSWKTDEKLSGGIIFSWNTLL